mmetsp:Transcript_25456/g.60549  ORF Transcript_25456/g.60549 Transcript_25456/m.60549 type:complete len:300 (-) Transcript_25456:361-1260(-)
MSCRSCGRRISLFSKSMVATSTGRVASLRLTGIWELRKKEWARLSPTEQRLAGSKVSMRPRRSSAPSGAPGSRSLRAVGSTGERPRRWSRISGSSIQLRRPEGVPMTEKITLSWSRLAGAENSSSSGERGKHERPGKRALRSCGGRLASGSMVSSSARMQPTLHTSMAAVYCCSRMSSGARYHLVTTWVVICLDTGGQAGSEEEETWRASAVPRGVCAKRRCSFRAQSSSSTTRARPKSQTLTSHVPLRSTLAGLRSRWRTWAEWRYSSATSSCCVIHCTCAMEMVCGEAISLRRSRST